MRTILRNAKIWLGGDQFASAVLFDSSQILTVGTDADVEAQRQNDDQIIDGQGRLVLPGLCDTHLHCYNKGCTLQNIDLQDVSSIEEIVSRSRDYIQAHPDIIQAFTNAIQKGLDYVGSHTPAEIADVIQPQFEETDTDKLIAIIDRYATQDTWKEDCIFTEEAFNLLQNILDQAGELTERVDYGTLITTEFAEKAAQ